jgi:hypothetical protein
VAPVRPFLATGHPAWPVHPAWDFAPLAISLVLLVLLRIARVPLRAGLDETSFLAVPVVIGAFVAGLLIDGLAEATGISIVKSIGVLLAASLLISVRSTSTS